MKTAVVILNWNGKELLERFLPSVVAFSAEATVYVADNASTDHSVDYVKGFFPTVKLIENAENGGFAKGYNDALSQLEEDVFVLLNSDVEVCEGWLLPLTEYLAANPDTAIVQPKLLDYKNKAYFEYSGAAGGYVDKLGYPYCRGRIFDTVEKDNGQYDQITPILWASGACLVIRRKVFNQLKGMDELYFAHQEEIDLCWRAHNAGYKAAFIPESKVYHLGGATLNAMNPQKTFLNFRNSLFNLLKNIPGKKVYGIIFVRLLLDGLAGIYFLMKAKPRHTWAIIKAHCSFYSNFSIVFRKRPKSFSGMKYATVFSIVWRYFIRGKKAFEK